MDRLVLRRGHRRRGRRRPAYPRGRARAGGGRSHRHEVAAVCGGHLRDDPHGRRYDSGRGAGTRLPRGQRHQRAARPAGGHPRPGDRQGPRSAVVPREPGRGRPRTRDVHPQHRADAKGLFMSTPASYDTIVVDYSDGVATITLNRPDALNALNLQVLEDVTAAAAAADADDSVRAIILTGAGKAFAAGADIKQMASLDFATAYRKNWFAGWSRLAEVSKPIIAAVNGFALGGGCELAMMADVLIASDKAKFGQPEINLGVLPGMG